MDFLQIDPQLFYTSHPHPHYNKARLYWLDRTTMVCALHGVTLACFVDLYLCLHAVSLLVCATWVIMKTSLSEREAPKCTVLWCIIPSGSFDLFFTSWTWQRHCACVMYSVLLKDVNSKDQDADLLPSGVFVWPLL